MLSLPIQALIIAARKHGLLDEDNLRRIGRRAEVRGVESLTQVRRWLDTGGDCTPRLGQALLLLLPPEDNIEVGGNLLLSHLADGGMGTVYLAHGLSGRLVVVKTLRSEYGDNPRYVHRFKREVAITAQLEHPHLVRCLDHGQHLNGQLFLVLEYVNGGDLAMLIANGHRLSETEALLIVYQTALGLEFAHRRSLIHRDIKPGNIFLAADGSAKLADFGLARSTTEVYSLQTIEGRAIGSPSFMSPEQVLGSKDIDTRSDLYAIGCLLYYTLAGQAPFTGTAQDIMLAHREAKVPDIRARRPEVSERTAKTILKLMMKDPARRYQDPLRLVESLRKTLTLLGTDPERQVAEATISLSLPQVQATFRGEPAMRQTEPVVRRMQTSEIIKRITPRHLVTPAPSAPDPEIVQPGHAPGESRADEPTEPFTPRGEPVLPPIPPTPAILTPRPQTRPVSSPTWAPAPPPAPPAPARVEARAFTPSAMPPAELSLADDGMQTVRQDGGEAHVAGAGEDACASTWITLDSGIDPDLHIILLGRPGAVLGKLRQMPVELTLRVYPIDLFAAESQRISKEHCRLRIDRERKAVLIEDLGSANGTSIDGRVLNPLQPWTLDEQRAQLLEIPQSLRLSLRVLPQRTQQVFRIAGAPAGKSGAVGIDTTNVHDAVTIRRLDNRPSLAYALVLRRVVIGGAQADLPCAGWEGPDIELVIFAGRWLWRRLGQPAWLPLVADAMMGDTGLVPHVGGYEDFR